VARCPITYELLSDEHQGRYSRNGLRRLSTRLQRLSDLPYDAQEQRLEAARRATKMSVQGVQPKLSARLRVSGGRFEIVDRGGEYILKPPNVIFPHLPENEDLTMRLAESAGIEVPRHGLLHARDGSWTYFVKRFDRGPRRKKFAVEDFAQLSGRSRTTKYDSSMEQVVAVIDRYATFPLVDRRELFLRTVFCFLTGGEDMHLKNFSLLTDGERIRLSPAYDLVNSSIVVRPPAEELALPLRGRKRNLSHNDLVDYFGRERLELTAPVIDTVLATLQDASETWPEIIGTSFLPDELQQAYVDLIKERCRRLRFRYAER
jgi:serine/threonine-protein kinase HipA